MHMVHREGLHLLTHRKHSKYLKKDLELEIIFFHIFDLSTICNLSFNVQQFVPDLSLSSCKFFIEQHTIEPFCLDQWVKSDKKA